MTASASDVRLACRILANRGVEECKLQGTPAYISWQDTALSVITGRPEVDVTLNSFREPEYIRLAEFVTEGSPDVCQDPAPVTSPLPGFDKLDFCTSSAFAVYATFSLPRLSSLDTCLLPEFEMCSYAADDQLSVSASWDWRSGQITPVLPRHSSSRTEVCTLGEASHSIASQGRTRGECFRLKREPRRRHSQLTLASSLCALADEDSACIIYARQVQKLGFQSADILRAHYEQYGHVKEVYLSNAHVKMGTPKFPVRVRPSGIAWILMADKAAAAAVFAAGEEQFISGVSIRVRQFEPRDHHEERKLVSVGEEDRARLFTASTSATLDSDAEGEATSTTQSMSVECDCCDFDTISAVSSN